VSIMINTVFSRGNPIKKAWIIPMRPLDISNLPNPSSRTIALGLTQPVTEMSTRNISGGKPRSEHKVDNFTAISVPTV
jgi:hypothetical protein